MSLLTFRSLGGLKVSAFDFEHGIRFIGQEFWADRPWIFVWSLGQGLGKHRQGRDKAIKAKLKFDKRGIGDDGKEQFAFQWWDHLFNKTASKITVEDDQAGQGVKEPESKSRCVRLFTMSITV
jgi:hypothetical protein